MKIPDEIYLQIEELGEKDHISYATWCHERINSTDIKYVRQKCDFKCPDGEEFDYTP
jgi:hypothetical protein